MSAETRERAVTPPEISPEEQERWVPLEGWPYEVSDLGRVRRVGDTQRWPHHRMVSCHPVGRRRVYMAFHLYRNGRRRAWRGHQLVLWAFVGPCPDGMVVDHINGNPRDNRLANLRYITVAENSSKPGEANPQAVLDEDAVLEIRERYARGSESQSALAREYGVAQTTISAAVRGATWGHTT